MTETFQQLLQWVNAHPGWAGLVVFVTAFVESLAIVGVIIPGVAILFAIGALIGAGALSFWYMVSWAVAGAVLGDGLSYWIGKRYQTQLTGIWPFTKHPATLQKGIDFFQRYGGKSVAMGRFFGPIRAVIPLVAGMMNMPTSRFVTANILSAIAWAPAYLIPGVVFGASMELASEVALRLVILLVTLLLSLWFLGWLSHRIFVLIQPHSQDILKTILKLGRRHPRLARIAGALGDPSHPESAGLSALAGLLVAASLLLMATALIPGGTLKILDSGIHMPLQNLATPTGDHIMLGISVLADSVTSLIIILIVWTLLSIYRLSRASRHWIASVGIIWVLTLAAKYLLLTVPSLIASLPDLYVLRASVMYGLAAVLISSGIMVNKRWRIYSAASILVMAVVLAQIYLGSNLTAVVHALLFGLIWTAATGVAYRTHAHQERLAVKQSSALGVSIICLASLSAISTPAPMTPPNITNISGSLSSHEWWNGQWRQLPSSRKDYSQLNKHPMNLQFSGNISDLRKTLINSGWKPLQGDNELEWLKLLSPSIDINSLPVLPHSHEGRYESYRFVKPAEDQRLSLYLWPSQFILQASGELIWLGEAGIQVKKQKMGLFNYPITQPNHEPALRQLALDLGGSHLLQSKLVDEKRILLARSAPNVSD